MRCTSCDEPMTEEEAKIAEARRGYPKGYCSDCRKEWKKNRNFQTRYGIGIQEYEHMLLHQDRKCIICHYPLTPDKTVVDHCHKTGKVRGLLCKHCNSAIGFLKEDIGTALRAIQYIYEHEKMHLLSVPKDEAHNCNCADSEPEVE